MTTAVALNASKVVPQGVSSVQDIPLTNIQESRTNPRRQFDETKLTELADNMRLYGILQPVPVRSMAGGEVGFYERVMGSSQVALAANSGDTPPVSSPLPSVEIGIH